MALRALEVYSGDVTSEQCTYVGVFEKLAKEKSRLVINYIKKNNPNSSVTEIAKEECSVENYYQQNSGLILTVVGLIILIALAINFYVACFYCTCCCKK